MSFIGNHRKALAFGRRQLLHRREVRRIDERVVHLHQVAEVGRAGDIRRRVAAAPPLVVTDEQIDAFVGDLPAILDAATENS